jgi:orotidine-5'-phosphate decarboxylase
MSGDVDAKLGFMGKLDAKWKEGKFLCVGLDSALEHLPPSVMANSAEDPQIVFNRAIVNATKTLVCAYKINLGFYAARGAVGIEALVATSQFIHDAAPNVPIILDGKFGDIDSTNQAYARFAFDIVDSDAVTVQPFLGGESLRPFLDRDDRGVFVLCKTSNPGSGELQDLVVEKSTLAKRPLYEEIAIRVAKEWNGSKNCGLVVGATYPGEIARVRASAGRLPILLPGIGTQGGTVKESVTAAVNDHGTGFLVNTSRNVIFASGGEDYAETAGGVAESVDSEIRGVVRRISAPGARA